MKTLCLAVSIALGAAAALNAQSSSSSNANRVTMTGCIERSPASAPTGTSGAVGASAPDTKFVLTAPSVGNTAGTAGTTADTASIVYKLDDADQSKVSPHEGHKVEITGTVEKSAAPGESHSPQTTTTTLTPPKLRVESVRVIASGCSR